MKIFRESVPTLFLLGSFALASLSVGCSCNDDEKQKEKASARASVVPALPENIDEAFLKALTDASSDCKPAKGKKRINCNGGEKNAIVLSFNKGERKRATSLPTLTLALEDKDDKIQALSAGVLYASFRVGLGGAEEAKSLTKKEAQKLLEAALALPSTTSMQAIPAATHAMVLTDQAELLHKALESGVSTQVRTMSYRYLMVYGRLDAFEKVKELSRGPGAAIVLSAIESPRNMKNWSEAEQEAICPWAVSFLTDERSPVAGNATAALSKCAGEHLDTLLASVEKTLKEKKFSFIHSTALRDVCGSALKRSPAGASEEQCAQVRKLQEEAAKSVDVHARVRAMTLSALAYAWPDEQSLDLAQSLSSSEEPSVARAAAQAVERLTPRLQGSKPGP